MPNTIPMALGAAVAANSAQNAVSASPGGMAQQLSGVIFVGTAQQVTAGTTLSSWVPTGVGTLTIPANFMVPGKTLRLRVYALFVTQAAPGTFAMTVALGSSTIWNSAGQTPTASLTGSLAYFEIDITCQTAGAAGTCSISGEFRYSTTVAAGINDLLNPFATGVTLNTTVANTLTIGSTNSVAGGAVITVNSFICEVLN